MAWLREASSSVFKFLDRRLPLRRIQSTDVQAAAAWSVAAGATAIWLVQPFDWIKRTFFEKPAEKSTEAT